MDNLEGVERPLSFSKQCTVCREIKDLGLFNKHKGHIDGLQSKCRECNRLACSDYYHSDKVKARRKRREQLYGTTPDDIEALAASQGGVCALCNGSLEGNRQFNIDHCHITDRVRGILCGSCNKGLGFFKDNVAVLRKAALYVEGI